MIGCCPTCGAPAAVSVSGGLTAKEAELLEFLRAYVKQHGQNTSPTYDEMAEAMGFKSKSGIRRLLLALQERRFIVVPTDGWARGVKIMEYKAI